MNTQINKRIPGITSSGLEFFNQEGKIKFIHNGNVKDFIEIQPIVLEIIKNEINKDVNVKKELERLYPHSEIEQIFKFIKCRYGGLDSTPDLSNGNLQASEYWECPIRENCMSKGILCKKVEYEGSKLEWEDIQLMKLLTTNKTNEAIADELKIPLGSFHSKKKKLYEIFNISTKQELAILCMLLNFI